MLGSRLKHYALIRSQLGYDSDVGLGDDAGEMAALGEVRRGARRTATTRLHPPLQPRRLHPPLQPRRLHPPLFVCPHPLLIVSCLLPTAITNEYYC